MSILKRLKYIGLSFFFFVLFLILLELSLRLYWLIHPLYQKGEKGFCFWVPDSSVGFVHNSNFKFVFPFPEHPLHKIILETNNLGLRMKHPTTLKKNKKRIIVIGDSHVDGIVNTEENCCYLLNTKLGREWEVLNCAVGGYSLTNYLKWLKKYGIKLNPNFCFLILYLGNDFDLFHPADCPFENRFIWKCVNSSLIAFYLYLPHFYKKCYTQYLFGQSGVYQYTIWKDKLSRNLLIKKLKRYFSKLKNLFDNKIYIVILPTKIQIEGNNPSFEKLLKKYNINFNCLYLDSLKEELCNVLKENKMHFIDLTPIFKRYYLSSGKKLYWDSDFHLNIEGHKLLSEILYSIVTEKLK